MKTISTSEIEGIPVQQRIQLVTDIWDSIAAEPQSVAIPEWHKQELEKRLQASSEQNNSGSSWAEVKKRILG